MKKSIMIAAGLAVGLTAAASAQVQLQQRQVIKQADERANAAAAQIQDSGRTDVDPTGLSGATSRRSAVEINKRADVNLSLPFANVNRFHERMQCADGETKQLIIAGTQDTFAAPQDPYTAGQSTGNFPNTNGYDGRAINQHFADRMTVPDNITKGYLMIGLRSNGSTLQTNDTISFATAPFPVGSGGPGFGSALTNLTSNGFQSNGNLTSGGAQYMASMANINLQNGQTLLQSLQAAGGSGPIYSYLQDDTSVDYIAASVCEKPKKLGMTWGSTVQPVNPVNGTAVVSCHGTSPVPNPHPANQPNSCNPYKGDTPCETELPILCIKTDASAKPASTDDSGQWTKWAKGVIGTTKPMAAPSTLSAANSACVAEFGTGWRVAEFHDGTAWSLRAYGNVGTLKPRFWTDIRNQPNAVCWDRSQ